MRSLFAIAGLLSTTAGACLAADGAGRLATWGHGDKVTVEAVIPNSACHMEIAGMLFRVADRWPDDVTVNVYALHTEAALKAMEPVGLSCAGYLVNGAIRFSRALPDGSRREARFAQMPSAGTYTAEDVCHAVLAGLCDAGVEVPDDPTVGPAGLEWPNLVSAANSDSWLREHHDDIRVMRPRALVLHFANGYTAEKAREIVAALYGAIRESSRWHGYEDPAAPAFLEYETARFVDLRDAPIPPGHERKNSATWPRDPQATCAVDYSRFFGDEMTKLIGWQSPADPAHTLRLAEMVAFGLVNELIFLGSHNEEDAAFESVELKQLYDEDLEPVEGEYRQAGNGGDDRQPWLGRSFRIDWINPDRGIGCAFENLGHAFEGMSNSRTIPYFSRYFPEFAGLDLDRRYGLPGNSFYSCDYGGADDPIEWLSPTSLRVKMGGEAHLLADYVAAGGNVHFPPNARHHYDLVSPVTVLSTIENWRLRNGPDGKDLAEGWTVAKFARYAEAAPDCMGPWLIYWRQNMPGLDNPCTDDAGQPMRNWWPFLFY